MYNYSHNRMLARPAPATSRHLEFCSYTTTEFEPQPLEQPQAQAITLTTGMPSLETRPIKATIRQDQKSSIP